MIYIDMLLFFVTYMMYCLSNSLILASFFMFVLPGVPFFLQVVQIFKKTILSLFVVFGFYFLLARMFCWTAWLADCLYCICPVLSLDSFFMNISLPSTILFFVCVTAVQLVLIVIPRHLSPLAFVAMVVVSNMIASLIKLGFFAVLV